MRLLGGRFLVGVEMTDIPREQAVQDAVEDYLRSKGCYFYRAMGNAMAAKGTPDLLCCIDGRFVAMELKREHNGAYGVTKPQEIRMRQIRKAGGLAYAVASVDDAAIIYRSLTEGITYVPRVCAQCFAPIPPAWWHATLCESCVEEFSTRDDGRNKKIDMVNGVDIVLNIKEGNVGDA